MKVRRNAQANGKYRVYSVWTSRTHVEKCRYSKRVDAQDFIIRDGGVLCYNDFDNENEAQAYLESKQGKIWW